MTQQVFEGTWEEVSANFAPELSGKRVRVTVVPGEANGQARTDPKRVPGQIYFGMFSGLPQPTEEDFRLAEFHGDCDDRLDW